VVRRLLLIRHGETDWNRQHRWQGWIDPPLNEVGEAQALARAAALVADGLDAAAVWSSDLQRAASTARIIAEHLDVDVTLDAGFRERHGGKFEGLDRAGLEARFPDELARWMAGDLDHPPGGESDDDVWQRVVAAIARRSRDVPDGSTVVIVTHGGVLRILTERSGGPREGMANVGGRWFAWDGGGLRAGDPLAPIDPVPPPRDTE
jgi:broad specificity phosphatase PhoE